MGAGIAHLFAERGYSPVLVDLGRPQLENGLAVVAHNLARRVRRGVIGDDEARQTLARIESSTVLAEAVAEAGLVIEAVTEQLSVKRTVFELADLHAPPEAILASNTSSISVTALGAFTSRPGSVVGMHFMNPAPVMALVEVVRGLATEDATVRAVTDLAKKLGKTPVEVSDFPGFVSNRVLMPMINEAAHALMEGVADARAVDDVMRLGMNHPLGPLALADLIGLDVCLDILEVLRTQLGEARFKPCPLLRKHVEAGWLGRKSGRGFHLYESDAR